MAGDTKHNEKSDNQAQNGRLHDARETATDAARRAVAGLEANPLGIVAGGLALGVLAGAVLPRSAKEKELLAPLGKQIGSRAREAFDAARSAGMEELSNRGLTKDGVRDQAKGVLDGVTKALSTAGAAAASGATDPNSSSAG